VLLTAAHKPQARQCTGRGKWAMYSPTVTLEAVASAASDPESILIRDAMHDGGGERLFTCTHRHTLRWTTRRHTKLTNQRGLGVLRHHLFAMPHSQGSCKSCTHGLDKTQRPPHSDCVFCQQEHGPCTVVVAARATSCKVTARPITSLPPNTFVNMCCSGDQVRTRAIQCLPAS